MLNWTKTKAYLLKTTLLVMALHCSGVQAQTPAKKQEFKPSYFGFIASTYIQNLVDFQDGSLYRGMSHMGRIGLNMTPKYKILATTSYSQNLKNSEENTLEDSSFTLVRNPVDFSKSFVLGGSFSALLPTSKASSIRDNLLLGARIGISLTLKPEVLPTWSFSASLNGGQNFHQYETNSVGSVLNKYALAQTISASKSISKFTLSIDFSNKNAWSYFGYMKQAFEHSEEISYSANDHWSLTLGHTNAGNALRADGYGSNIALVNENSSMVYTTLALGF